MKHELPPHTPGSPLSKAQTALLEAFERLLVDRAVALGLIAASDAGRIGERHVLDSLRGAACLTPGASVLDLGSGAGLPGVPIAIARPDVLITLSEKRRQRAAFLELVVGELSLSNVQVHPGDARGLPGPYDACLARAFGDIAKAWELAEPRLSEHGALVYWAGRSFDRARGVPDGTLVTLLDPPTLANSGPIAIMTRQ